MGKISKTIAVILVALGIIPFLSACGGAEPEDVSTLITENGQTAAFIIKYRAELDGTGVTPATYSVDGEEVARVFVSNVNPFDKKDSPAASEGKASQGNSGRYAVVFLRESGSSKEVGGAPAIQQVAGIKTTSGKEIKAWSKARVATKAFPVAGGRAR